MYTDNDPVDEMTIAASAFANCVIELGVEILRIFGEQRGVAFTFFRGHDSAKSKSDNTVEAECTLSKLKS